jgi:hypothetical protein
VEESAMKPDDVIDWAFGIGLGAVILALMVGLAAMILVFLWP